MADDTSLSLVPKCGGCEQPFNGNGNSKGGHMPIMLKCGHLIGVDCFRKAYEKAPSVKVKDKALRKVFCLVEGCKATQTVVTIASPNEPGLKRASQAGRPSVMCRSGK